VAWVENHWDSYVEEPPHQIPFPRGGYARDGSVRGPDNQKQLQYEFDWWIRCSAEKERVVNQMSTFHDNSEDERLFGRPSHAERSTGMNPPSERGEDQARDEVMRELEEQPSRPLSGEEKRAAETDSGREANVYAPASERVAKDPLPGDREIMDHMDTSTAERKAARALAEIESAAAHTADGHQPPPGSQAASTSRPK
jgi:hypothetical protein